MALTLHVYARDDLRLGAGVLHRLWHVRWSWEDRAGGVVMATCACSDLCPSPTKGPEFVRPADFRRRVRDLINIVTSPLAAQIQREVAARRKLDEVVLSFHLEESGGGRCD